MKCIQNKNSINKKLIFYLASTCFQPSLSLDKKSLNASAPLKINRSKFFTIASTTFIYCNTNYQTKYNWTVKKLNKTTLEFISSINLSENPTSTSSELLIQRNTLDYGLYNFKLSLVVYFNTINQVTNEAEVFIEIIQTGLVIFGAQYGVSNFKIGSKQTFYLNPSVYSFDLDSVITPDKLSFLYYCTTKRSLNKNGLSQSGIDLYTYQNSVINLDRNQTCFGSKSKNLSLKGQIIYKIFIFIL